VRWWHSPDIVRDLHLDVRQLHAIERLYETSLDEIRATAATAVLTRARLERLLEMNTSEEALTTAGFAVVEADIARRRLRTLMLYRMYCVLTPIQRSRLKSFAAPRAGDAARRAGLRNLKLSEP
jgi:hypothetical protein